MKKAKATYVFKIKGETFESKKPIDWEERRFELIKQLLPALASRGWHNGKQCTDEFILQWTFNQANKMIELLQEDIKDNLLYQKYFE